MRTTLLGSLLDVAARNLARGARGGGAVRGRRRLPARHAARRGRPAGGQLPRQHPGPGHRAAPLRRARGRAAGAEILARRRRAGRLLRAEGRARGARRRARLPAARVRADERAVPPPGPERRGLGRRRAARLARRGPPAGLPDLGHRRRGRLRNRRGAAARRGDPRRGGLRGRHHLPGGAARPRGRRPRRGQRGDVRAAVLAGGGELLHEVEVFDLYEGEQLGEGKKSLALRARVPRRRPHARPTRRSSGPRTSIAGELEKIGRRRSRE